MELNKQNENSIQMPALVFGIVLLCLLFFIGATYDEIVSDKNKQLEFIQKQIDDSKKTIAANSETSSDITNSIDSITTAMNSIEDFLKDYQNENYLTVEQIASETNNVLSLEKDVGRIQDSFRNKVVSLYKHGKDYELELLLSSKTANEFLQRNEYLQKFAQSRKKDLRELKSKKYMLDEKKKMLNLSVSSRRFYVEAKRNEKTRLEEKLKTLTSKKNELAFASNSYNSKIGRLESEQNNIRNFLSNFSDNKQTFKPIKNARLNYSTDNLEPLKGMLNPPLDISLMRREFGTTVNNATNTVSFNFGADFSAAAGSKVYSVAAGTVTITGEVPFYGKAVVIDNGYGFRTVYSCLSEVSVKAGDKIKLNQIIARSGDDLDGQGLHFEIWKNNVPLNPREWIRM